jgi:hypothetical protein
MIWVYLLAVTAAAVASVHYIRTTEGAETQPRTSLGQRAVTLSGMSAMGLFFALLIAGMLIGPWWWSLAAFGIGVAMNLAVEESPLRRLPRASIIPLTAAALALTALLTY